MNAVEAMKAIASALDRAGVRYMVVGSLSVTAYGIPRATKDADFVVSHTLAKGPRRLLLVATENIDNEALEILLRANLARIVPALEESNFVELGRDYLTSHV